ncbi:MATE family efflux transporter [Spelaeicoccus albus]|uniref:MATE family efflux transporter n=1 Tax=Spelaeicoccus albus TaxID=1280376 RepID=UPI001C549710|nr:MATE family efflux transporter [Spelaeicoccus albus]
MTLRSLDREILRLAVPALGALVAEPLFLMTDTALVGHLGQVPLAALGIAGTIVQTVIGLLVFLAYATTPMVARLLGAGDRKGAVHAGIDGMWLAVGIGCVLIVLGVFLTPTAVSVFPSSAAVATAAGHYVFVSLAGMPAMLLVIAASGLLRGLQDTKTPLLVAGSGFAANAVLNAILIYPVGLGIVGSALGTVAAQWGMALWYIVIAVRAARRAGASLRPGLRGIRVSAGAGGWLLMRTASLRAGILLTVSAAAGFGVVQLAAYQVITTIFSTLSFALDALAIAGQAMIGHGLGRGDVAGVRAATSRLLVWGIGSGIVGGVVIAALAPVFGFVFSSDPDVRHAIFVTAFVLAIGVPLAGYVFVLDGVLIGAGDARYLALTGVVNLACYLPLLGIVVWAGPTGDAALVWLWVAFGLGYMGARAVTLGLRSRSDRWIVTGT